MEISMYVCTNCDRVYKIKGNDKRAKCPHCEGMFLKDMHESLEQWQAYSKDEKDVRISRAKMPDSEAGTAQEHNGAGSVAHQNKEEQNMSDPATEQNEVNPVAQQSEPEPATGQNEVNPVAQQSEPEPATGQSDTKPAAQPTEAKPAGADLFGFGFEEDESALAEFGFDFNKGGVKSFDFGDEEEDNLFSSFSVEDEAKPSVFKQASSSIPEDTVSETETTGSTETVIDQNETAELAAQVSREPQPDETKPAEDISFSFDDDMDDNPLEAPKSTPLKSVEEASDPKLPQEESKSDLFYFGDDDEDNGAVTEDPVPVISVPKNPVIPNMPIEEDEDLFTPETGSDVTTEDRPDINPEKIDAKPTVKETYVPTVAEAETEKDEDTADKTETAVDTTAKTEKAEDTADTADKAETAEDTTAKTDSTENAAERKPEIHKEAKIINEYHYEEQVGNLKLKRIFSATGMAVGLIIAGVGAYMSATGMDFGMDKATTALPIPGIIADCLGMVVVCHFGVKLSETLDNNK
ncbi:MAG: hypothetical protein K6E53_08525 [Lachnospiraceae bacterium]|nr:hypothetical protein [Lachnospiraceae bacterium]